jgi:hypothetical protein
MGIIAVNQSNNILFDGGLRDKETINSIKYSGYTSYSITLGVFVYCSLFVRYLFAVVRSKCKECMNEL